MSTTPEQQSPAGSGLRVADLSALPDGIAELSLFEPRLFTGLLEQTRD